MKRRMAWVILSCGVAAASAATRPEAPRGSGPAADFHDRVVATYGFHPHGLSKEDVQARSATLDAFWAHAKADPDGTLPLLRAELARTPDADFFAYDGAKLLLSLSRTRQDQQLALSSLAKVDLRDVQHTDYLKTVQWLAAQGLDTRAAAFHVLGAPDFKAYIPEHVLTLGQDYALVYMLYPMTPSTFESELLDRLGTETDVASQKSLLLATWYLMTPAGTAALKTFSERPGVDPSAAGYARELLARTSGLSLSLSSPATLRDERMKMMRRPISDEALIEFDSLTMKLMARQ